VWQCGGGASVLRCPSAIDGCPSGLICDPAITEEFNDPIQGY
jgi:hypothetical protein